MNTTFSPERSQRIKEQSKSVAAYIASLAEDKSSYKAEEAFVEWFHSDYGQYSLRSEVFFTDCLVNDEKTRQDLLYKFVVAAFMAGYEEGSK